MTLQLMTSAKELRALVHEKKVNEAASEVVRICKLMNGRNVLAFQFRTNLKAALVTEAFKKEGFDVSVEIRESVCCDCSSSCQCEGGTFVLVSAERPSQSNGLASQLHASVKAWEAKTSTTTAYAVQQKMKKHLKLKMRFEGRFNAETKADLESQGFVVKEIKQMGYTASAGKYCRCQETSIGCNCAMIFETTVSADESD